MHSNTLLAQEFHLDCHHCQRITD